MSRRFSSSAAVVDPAATAIPHTLVIREPALDEPLRGRLRVDSPQENLPVWRFLLDHDAPVDGEDSDPSRQTGVVGSNRVRFLEELR